MNQQHKLASILQDLIKNLDHRSYTLGEVHASLGTHTPAIGILFLSVPFLQPIPVPGLSTVLGIIMSILGFTIMTNISLKIPKTLAKRKLPENLLQIVLKTLNFILVKTDRFIKKRGVEIIEKPAMNFFIGLFVIISALFLSLPLPPGTNFPPAIVSFILALGLLEKDLALITFGFIIFIVEVVVIYYTLDWIIATVSQLF